MRVAPRSTRRSTTAQPSLDKENRTSERGSVNDTSNSRRARHRLSITELARLEDVFRKQTHPSRQQKKDLAAELAMDYKTVTIWFQNKRQTSKRGQPPPVERPDKNAGRTKADSCLRSVSSPSLNATLDSFDIHPAATSSESKSLEDGLNVTTSEPEAILAAEPLEHPESVEANDKAMVIESAETVCQSQTVLESPVNSAKSNNRGQPVEQEQTTKTRFSTWKRMGTLEWACERLAKRRKLQSRDNGYTRLGSEEAEDGDSTNARMDSALSLLSLASSIPEGSSRDVMSGASLLLSLKHSWSRK